MKKLSQNKFLVMAALFLVTALLFIFGKGQEASGAILANAAVITISEEDKAGLSEESLKVVNACQKLLSQTLDQYKAGAIGKGDVESMINSFKTELSNKEIKELQDKLAKSEEILIKQGTVLAELQLTNGNAIKQTLLQVVEKHKAEIAASTQKGKDFTFEIKADTLRASVVGNPAAQDLSDIGQLAHRKLTVYDIFRKVPVSKDRNGVVRYVDWDAATTARAAAAIAEGGTFPSSEAKWATYTLSLEKVGDSIPMSEEMMYDASAFAAELENFLKVNVAIKVDTDLVAGNGTSPNINGLKNQIPNYTAAASGITDASIYDLIVKVREAITSAYGSKYNPNVALMNIADINKMKLKKDANNNYILPPFYDRNGNVVDGISVIECNSFAANTMAIGDSRYGAIYEEPGVTVQTGFATGDFESDMMTIKARRRLNLLIRNVDRTGWLEVTSISGALTTLATAP